MRNKYLLDTHVCLWAFAEPLKLSEKVKEIIENSANRLYVSQVSLFEIAIKIKINKLPYFQLSLEEFIDNIKSLGYLIAPIKNEHFFAYTGFVYNDNHKDPFDRLLIATCNFEKIPIISKDEKFTLYKNTIEIIR